MSQPDHSLGTCAMCGEALIRNRRDKHADRVILPGESAPDKAYYPDILFEIVAVWCPACSLVHSLESPDLGFVWQNPEVEETRRRQAKP